MISSVIWVPQGVADPTPKRYEMSPAEIEMLAQHHAMEDQLEQDGDDDVDDDDDDDDDQEEETMGQQRKSTQKIVLPTIDPSTLPPELRMDDYSDDEDAARDATVGNLLIPDEEEVDSDNEDLVKEMEEVTKEEKTDDDQEDKDSDSDSDSDDDLEDAVDTREFTPVDVEGLAAMQMGTEGGQMFEDDQEDLDDSSDVEDTNLKENDALILVAKTEEDFASLEVYVYEKVTGNLFVHHDIALPTFPLCLSHGTMNHEGNDGNYVAIGSFSPGIEVWNLDVLDALEPTFILGGEDTSAADDLMRLNMARASSGKALKKKKATSNGGLRPGSHTDAVMSLAWNNVHRQVLASGSADCTVKVWDITQVSNTTNGGVAATFSHHRGKVQSLAWHPTEGTILASGSFDQTVALLDARTNDGSNVKKVKLPADCEAIAWDPFNSQYLSAASEDGTISCWDVRKFGQKPVWTFVAHEFGGVSDMSYNSQVPGMLATCAIDKTVALWDTYGGNATPQQSGPIARPHPCGQKEMGVGKLYSVSFYPSTPWLLGCGGGGNSLSIWDMSSEAAIQNRFGERINGGVSAPVEEEGETGLVQNEDFEAMMAAGDAATEKAREQVKKTKKKTKKKAHRKGR